MENQAPAIFDCHLHLYDGQSFRYPMLATPNPVFKTLFGGEGLLPARYLAEDYARDTAGLSIAKTLWIEFISNDPSGEVRWASELADAHGRPDGLLGRVDFLDPSLHQVLEHYAALPRLRAVRQHLGWHPSNPQMSFASRPDLMTDSEWRRGLSSLHGLGLTCELEMFSTQLADFLSVAREHPQIQFVLPLMGWPVDLTSEGHVQWKRALTSLATCSNVAVKIFGLECIFGIHWTVSQVRPWVLDVIDIFGPGRCMFASHTPICMLACTVEQLYSAYLEIISGFSQSEKLYLLHDTAAKVYGIS